MLRRGIQNSQFSSEPQDTKLQSGTNGMVCHQTGPQPPKCSSGRAPNLLGRKCSSYTKGTGLEQAPRLLHPQCAVTSAITTIGHPGGWVRSCGALLLGFGCVLLGVDSLRGGLAEGNRMTLQRLLDQNQADVYRGERHIPPPPRFVPLWAKSRTLC